MWKNPEIYVIVAKRWSKIGKKQEISGKMWKFPGKLQKIWISRQKSADFLRKSPSETVLINLKAHQRRCKSLLKPHRRRWNFKKFWEKCGNSQENVEIPWKMWKFPEKFSKKPVFLGNSQKNVEIPMKMWKFSKKKSIWDGAYQFESSSETVQVSGETSSETVQVSVETSSETVEL